MRKGILVWAGVFFALGVACNDAGEPDLLQQSPQAALVADESGTVVSQTQAIRVAEAFFLDQSGGGLATRSEALKSPASVRSIETDAGEAAMHVINYPGGGFAIVSATRDYHPVLAYSDQGAFELSADMGPVEVWLAETREAIRTVESLDAEARAAIRAEWSRLDPESAALSSAPRTRAYDANMQPVFYTRLGELMTEYYPQGYNVMSLDQAQSYFQYASEYEAITALADQYGSPHNYTIIGIQQMTVTNTVGPLTTTIWDQGYPYNYYCLNEYGNRVAAGCAAIATAQLMKAYEWPSYIDWDAMPDVYPSSMLSSNTVLPEFISEVGEKLGLDYDNSGNTGSSDYYVDLKNTLKYYGYNNITISNHNTTDVINWITNERKPMMMVGYYTSNGHDSNNKSSGHQWICDGVKEQRFRVRYFVEFIHPRTYTYSHNWHWPTSSPGEIFRSYLPFFRMNWGWGGTHDWGGSNDGWYSAGTHTAPPRSDGQNYQYLRKNIYAKP